MTKNKAPKKLIVSMKSSSEAMADFKKAFQDVSKGRLKGTHYEISFDNKKGFDRFVKNIGILLLKLVFSSKVFFSINMLW